MLQARRHNFDSDESLEDYSSVPGGAGAGSDDLSASLPEDMAEIEDMLQNLPTPATACTRGIPVLEANAVTGG